MNKRPHMRKSLSPHRASHSPPPLHAMFPAANLADSLPSAAAAPSPKHTSAAPPRIIYNSDSDSSNNSKSDDEDEDGLSLSVPKKTSFFSSIHDQIRDSDSSADRRRRRRSKSASHAAAAARAALLLLGDDALDGDLDDALDAEDDDDDDDDEYYGPAPPSAHNSMLDVYGSSLRLSRVAKGSPGSHYPHLHHSHSHVNVRSHHHHHNHHHHHSAHRHSSTANLLAHDSPAGSPGVPNTSTNPSAAPTNPGKRRHHHLRNPNLAHNSSNFATSGASGFLNILQQHFQQQYQASHALLPPPPPPEQHDAELDALASGLQGVLVPAAARPGSAPVESRDGAAEAVHDEGGTSRAVSAGSTSPKVPAAAAIAPRQHEESVTTGSHPENATNGNAVVSLAPNGMTLRHGLCRTPVSPPSLSTYYGETGSIDDNGVSAQLSAQQLQMLQIQMIRTQQRLEQEAALKRVQQESAAVSGGDGSCCTPASITCPPSPRYFSGSTPLTGNMYSGMLQAMVAGGSSSGSGYAGTPPPQAAPAPVRVPATSKGDGAEVQRHLSHLSLLQEAASRAQVSVMIRDFEEQYI